MKKALIYLVFVTTILAIGSCEREQAKVEYASKCERAEVYMTECLGYSPYLESCTLELAERILDTPCDNLEDLWR